jgi:hypothetical protein
VIDVTRLFTTEVTEFSARTRLRARGFDASRSFIEKTKSFPTNIEVEVSQTNTSPPENNPGGGGGGPQPQPNPFAQGMRAGTNATVVMHYSMVKLPEKPMMPRLFDERVGYFSVRKYDYGIDEHRAPERRFITRWRLEKKDPNAEISEPVKPIVYYVDPATPTKWIPYIRRELKTGSRRLKPPDSKTRSSQKRPLRKRKILTGMRKMPVTRSSATSHRPSKTLPDRTCTTRALVKFWSRTSSITTT